MALENLMTEAMAHSLAGIALSLADFLTYALTNPKTKRLEQKTQCVQAIEAVLDVEPQPTTDSEQETEHQTSDVSQVASCSPEYAQSMATIQHYLRTSGLVKLQLPLFERLKDGIRNLLFDEKINTLSNVPKFGIACGVEIFYDVIIDFPYNSFAGIAKTLYQIPAFFVGLWLGNGIKKVLAIFITSSDERKLDKTLKQLLRDTRIVEIVVNYAPPEAIKQELAGHGIEMYVSQLTRAGKGAYTHLQVLAETAKIKAGDMINFSEKQQEQEQEEKEERRKRFDELTKNH